MAVINQMKSVSRKSISALQLWQLWVVKELLVHINFDRRKNILQKSLWTGNSFVTHILQNSIYVQQKKETHPGLILNLNE